MLKIRRSCDRFIYNMRIPIPGKDGLYIEAPPRRSADMDIDVYAVEYLAGHIWFTKFL